MTSDTSPPCPTCDVDAPSAALLAAAAHVRHGTSAFAARARAERRGALTLNQTSVLGLLHAHDSMTPGEVAHRMRMRPQALTKTFAALEEHGWVTRSADPLDGRQSLLTLAPSGRQALAAEMRPRDAWVAAAMRDNLTAAERDLLVIAATLLTRLADVDASVAPVEP